MAETWKPVHGHPMYEASSEGRIRSFKGRQPRILKEYNPRTRLYLQVKMDGLTISVHRVVMLAFVGPRPADMQIRHLNGDHHDNRSANLVYGTRSENMRDQVRHGTHVNSKKTACKRGHPFTTENTMVTSWGGRRCLTCHRMHSRARTIRRREQRLARRGVAS